MDVDRQIEDESNPPVVVPSTLSGASTVNFESFTSVENFAYRESNCPLQSSEQSELSNPSLVCPSTSRDAPQHNQSSSPAVAGPSNFVHGSPQNFNLILATDAGASAVAEPCSFIFKPRPLPENFNSFTFKEKRKYVRNVQSKFRSSNKKLKRAEAIANDNRLRSIPVAEFPNVTPSEMGLVAESFQPCTEIQILSASTNANGFHNTPVTEFPIAAPSEISLLVSSVSDDEDNAIAASLECRPTVPGISEEGLNSKTEIIVLTETERSERHCSICLQILKVGRKARLIKICGHIGCVGCFAEWLKTSSRCPRCNQSL